MLDRVGHARRHLHLVLAAIRLINGGGALLVPRAYGRRMGVDPEVSPAGPYVLRLFGVRTVIIGAELLLRKGAALDEALRVGRIIHASDAIAAVLAGATGQLPRRNAVLAAAISTVNTVLAFSARPRRRWSPLR
ncbi:MAG: hypothetical protein M3N16_00175 [Actinomycetota bacterium]|nr:hypothetical protein [Actinomycetota bacterium]